MKAKVKDEKAEMEKMQRTRRAVELSNLLSTALQAQLTVRTALLHIPAHAGYICMYVCTSTKREPDCRVHFG